MANILEPRKKMLKI